MKVFSPDFDVQPMSPYPSEPRNWDSLKEAKYAYENFVEYCDRFGNNPLPLWVFVGQYTDREEEKKEGMAWPCYPDYPHYIIEVGPRGGIICGRAW